MVQAKLRNSRAVICCQRCVLAAGEATEETYFEAWPFSKALHSVPKNVALRFYIHKLQIKRLFLPVQQNKISPAEVCQSLVCSEGTVSEKLCCEHAVTPISALGQRHCLLFLESIKLTYLLLVNVAV